MKKSRKEWETEVDVGYGVTLNIVSAQDQELPLHRTEANYGVSCSTCDDGGCPDCTDPS